MADVQQPQNRDPAARQADGTFGPGNRANPGGKPKAIREIERMLDQEHRTPQNMRAVFDRLRQLATEDRVSVFMSKKGQPVESVTPPDPAFMRLYLERVLGPVKDLEPDLADAPEAVLRWYAERN